MAELPSPSPLRTPGTRPHNLPVERSGLLGRERELTFAKGVLLREDVGLLTLTGPGGSGKTRLGLALASVLFDRFEDGAFFVDLAPIRDAGLVASAIARVLNIRGMGGRALGDDVSAYLRDRQLMLLLDNFEQVLPATSLVSELLARCAQLKVLVTSRTALHLRGEYELAVPPLAVPDATTAPSVGMLSRYPATALFVERVTAIRPELSIGDEQAAAIAEICRRLDGLPLAIELAAARCRLLPPTAVLGRLERRLPLLTGGPRDLPARQQALRDTIGWSYDLLDATEQRLFRRLAVFVGGFTIEAAEAVGGLDEHLGTEVFDGVNALAAHSLLTGAEQGSEPHLGMLETIREFGIERLEAEGEIVETRRRHADYFLALVERAAPELEGPDQRTWRARLARDHDNLRVALTWYLGDGDDPERGLRLAGGLGYFWYLDGHYGEGRRWLRQVIAFGSDAAPALRARALYQAGFLAYYQAEYGEAEALLREALDLYRGLGDGHGTTQALLSLGIVAIFQGAYERAATRLEESLALSRQRGDRFGLARSLNNLGFAAYAQADYRRASALLEEGLEASRLIGDEAGVMVRLGHLVEVACALHQYDRAAAFADRMASLSLDSGSTGLPRGALRNLGLIALQRGDREGAKVHLAEAVLQATRLGHRLAIAECVEGVAELALWVGAHAPAAALLGAAEAARDAIGAPLPPYRRPDRDRVINDLRRHLGDGELSRAWADGRAMAPDETVRRALALVAAEAVAADMAGPTPEGDAHRDAPSPLTAREQEVAALVARGLTNRQIAAELVISGRTAGTHVAHILEKLGFATRAQIAAWAIEHRLVATERG